MGMNYSNSILLYDLTSIYQSISHENSIELQNREERNSSFFAANLAQWKPTFSSPLFAFWVGIASLNSSSSLEVPERRGPLEHIRCHRKRVGSGDLGFCREIRKKTEFSEMKNSKELKHKAKAKREIRTDDWVMMMEWNKGYLNGSLCAKNYVSMLHCYMINSFNPYKSLVKFVITSHFIDEESETQIFHSPVVFH